MLSPKQTRRAQKLIFLIVLGLAAYTFVVFQPLARRADEADKPLRTAWDKLSKARVRGAGVNLDLTGMDRQLRQAHSAVTALERAQERVLASISTDSGARLKNREPFQLVDFQIEKLL